MAVVIVKKVVYNLDIGDDADPIDLTEHDAYTLYVQLSNIFEEKENIENDESKTN